MQKSLKQTVSGWMVGLLGLGGMGSASPAQSIETIVRSADGSFTVDFSGLPVGQRVWEVALGQGVSGSGVATALLGINQANTVHVRGQRTERPGDANRAMTFDGECGGVPEGCSGNDDDLYAPGQGNLLIVSQDNNPADPNDNHEGGTLEFDFSNFGPGAVTVRSITVFDVSHQGATVTLYAEGERLEELAIPRGDTGEQTTVEIDTPGVDFMRVTVADSFAVDDLVFEVQ